MIGRNINTCQGVNRGPRLSFPISTMVAVEFVTFTPSDAFRADYTVVEPAIKALEEAVPGAVKG